MSYNGRSIKAEDLILGSSIIIIGVAGIVLLVGGVTSVLLKKYKLNKTQPVETTIETSLIDNTQLGEYKIYNAGEHYIRVRVLESNNKNNEYSITGIDNIPEGYEVYSITPYTVKAGNGSATAGYDIWYVNDEKVKVVATYNTETETYGYYTFGEVVEEEKQLTK